MLAPLTATGGHHPALGVLTAEPALTSSVPAVVRGNACRSTPHLTHRQPSRSTDDYEPKQPTRRQAQRRRAEAESIDSTRNAPEPELAQQDSEPAVGSWAREQPTEEVGCSGPPAGAPLAAATRSERGQSGGRPCSLGDGSRAADATDRRRPARHLPPQAEGAVRIGPAGHGRRSHIRPHHTLAPWLPRGSRRWPVRSAPPGTLPDVAFSTACGCRGAPHTGPGLHPPRANVLGHGGGVSIVRRSLASDGVRLRCRNRPGTCGFRCHLGPGRGWLTPALRKRSSPPPTGWRAPSPRRSPRPASR